VREDNKQRSAHADDVDARSRKLSAKVMVVGQGNYSQCCDSGWAMIAWVAWNAGRQLFVESGLPGNLENRYNLR